MNKLERTNRYRMGCMVLLMSCLAAGCSGSRDAILGIDSIAVRAPTVTAVTPTNNANGVAIGNPAITARFSEPMAPITGASSFTVTCVSPCTNPTGTVALDASKEVATFTLTAGTTLEPLTSYTATVTAAQSLATGLALEAPYVWSFTTGAPPDTTRPRVLVTQPATTNPGPTTGVSTNTPITAVFSEDMDPATIRAASFTLTCVAPCTAPSGTVSYAVDTRTAVFSPATVLAASQTYTATITMAATDLAGNALAGNQAGLPAASDYVWSFTTAAPVVSNDVTVRFTNPIDGATGVCPSAAINVTFRTAGSRIDPTTISGNTFTVTGPGLTAVTAQSVLLDNPTGLTATFTPQNSLTNGVVYTARIKSGNSGVKDLDTPANTLASDFTWRFTAGPATGDCLPPDLKSAAAFGGFGGAAGMTNQGTQTVINGDIGTTAVSTKITGFHDAGPGCTYTETGSNIGTVNGLIYTAAPPPTPACPSEGTAATFLIAQQAQQDAQIAFDDLAGRPGNPGAANLASLTLAPGVYTAPAGSFRIQGGDLTLDANGNGDAIWVFQMASTLTVGGPGAAFPQSVTLIGGAQAKNVFWQVGSAATINAAGGGTMAGTIITRSGATFSTAGNVGVVTLNGRVLSLNASVTLVNTVINVPAP